MGRRNKEYVKDLHQQAYERFEKMQVFGVSKKESIDNGTEKDKIFSFNTYQSYWKHTKYFIKYIRGNHPECTVLKSAKQYVNEWLQKRTDEGLSAWTIHLEAKAMGKLFGITPDDEDYFHAPKRERLNIKRSRTDRIRDKHFSVTNNDELIKFCRGTGLRRSELEDLRGKDLISRDKIESEISELEKQGYSNLNQEQRSRLSILKDTRMFDAEYFTHIRNGKGGRERISPIIGANAGQIVERMKNTLPESKVWLYVGTNADIHSYRSDYAIALYKSTARPIEEIPRDTVNNGTGRKYQGEVYACRKDEAGRKLDKKAMLICSKALGHNRLDVIANNYIRGL